MEHSTTNYGFMVSQQLQSVDDKVSNLTQKFRIKLYDNNDLFT